jgi:hypothetical protein
VEAVVEAPPDADGAAEAATAKPKFGRPSAAGCPAPDPPWPPDAPAAEEAGVESPPAAALECPMPFAAMSSLGAAAAASLLICAGAPGGDPAFAASGDEAEAAFAVPPSVPAVGGCGALAPFAAFCACGTSWPASIGGPARPRPFADSPIAEGAAAAFAGAAGVAGAVVAATLGTMTAATGCGGLAGSAATFVSVGLSLSSALVPRLLFDIVVVACCGACASEEGVTTMDGASAAGGTSAPLVLPGGVVFGGASA